MVMNTSCTAIRTDRGLSAAHGGTPLASWMPTAALKTRNGLSALVPFGGVPAYVADQESHPPRGNPA